MFMMLTLFRGVCYDEIVIVAFTPLALHLRLNDINPLNPIVHFWLHHTAHCAEKIVSTCLHAGSALAERVGQGEMGGVTGRVLCTWWLLGLALKRPWLVPGGPPHALTPWTGLENTTLTLQRAGFWPERLVYGNR